jgi:hypothetical protein
MNTRLRLEYVKKSGQKFQKPTGTCSNISIKNWNDNVDFFLNESCNGKKNHQLNKGLSSNEFLVTFYESR